MLNPKRLYAADGYAVRELLKMATLLYEAKVALQRSTDVEVRTHRTRKAGYIAHRIHTIGACRTHFAELRFKHQTPGSKGISHAGI